MTQRRAARAGDQLWRAGAAGSRASGPGLRALGRRARRDRVAAYLPNAPRGPGRPSWRPPASGAVWTSCSPDFGASSVIDRFRADRAQGAHRGRRLRLRRPAVRPHPRGSRPSPRRCPAWRLWSPWTTSAAPRRPACPRASASSAGTSWPPAPGTIAGAAGPLEFEEVAVSRTRCGCCTPRAPPACPSPSCTGTAGIVLEHLKALCLHQDLTAGDVFFWYTTTGWMMWNYLVGGPAGRDHDRAVRRQRHLPGHRRAVGPGGPAPRFSYFGTGAPLPARPA